ncbi:MAG: cation diffusion facilitator family transporter [Spirochaetaceae bacterium]|jgi:cation diffusion facilitator family transporter|nr:cation diffusion facilitator family transporter [Spirochaetaceae bacterium]
MDKTKDNYLEGLISIAVNSALFALKLWTGITTGSIALTADAWHTLSDSVSSIVVVIAVKLSVKKADKEHPFGHGRIEHIASLFIAFFLGIIAYEFLKNAAMQFRGGASVEYGAAAVAVTAVSILVKEVLAQYAFYIAKKTGNSGVKADGWHHRTDALSSIIVLAGILSAKRFWWIDCALGGAVALLLFYAACKIIQEASAALLGEEPNPDLIKRITDKVKTVYKDDLQLHHFHIHNYVVHKELTFHIRLNKNLTIEQGHTIATEIENTIADTFEIIATIHVEPLDA